MAMNLAYDLVHQGQRVTLVDLDVVNPYFRSSDYATALREHGVRLVAPNFVRSNLDVPSLPAEMYATLEPEWPADTVIFDVGGDDAGATALGVFSSEVVRQPYQMLYVINQNRPMTATPAAAAALLGEIEGAARIRATAVVCNTHLQADTTLETVSQSLEYGQETARLANLPLAAVTVPAAVMPAEPLADRLAGTGTALYPVRRFVLSPWETGVE